MTDTKGARSQADVVLSDGAVALRPIRLDDAEEHLAGEDGEMERWLSGGPSTLDTVTRYLRDCVRAWEIGGEVRTFGIIDAGSRTLAGVLEIQTRQPYLDEGQANLAYGLYPRWRGRGFATRAVALTCQYLWSADLGREAVIRVQPDNHASAAVAQRAGFRFDRRRRDASIPLDWYIRARPSPEIDGEEGLASAAG